MQLLPFVSRALPLPLPLPPSNSFKSGLSPNTLAQRRNTSTSGGLPPGVPVSSLVPVSSFLSIGKSRTDYRLSFFFLDPSLCLVLMLQFNLLGFSLTPPSTKGKPALLWNRKLPSSHHWIPGNQMVHGLDRPGSLSDLTHCTVACILECFFWVVYARSRLNMPMTKHFHLEKCGGVAFHGKV
uniref:Uncharacterized protein LOC105047927 n=1 Tax=Elaeis guineensis var. tenera TaxID=51953 RepID=A0A8N4EZZ1_ELAGV|nr:uncharacterized protein LOC105047927 [Elaeis guineensis]